MLTDLAWQLRSALPWSLPAPKWPVSVRAVTDGLSVEGVERLADLGQRYDLTGWERVCDPQDWRESLYVLDVIDRLLQGAGLPPGRCLDVGSKNGTYLPGLAAAAPRGWDAVELDAHRRYLWGATRRAHGERMAAAFPGCRFVADDVRHLPGPYALVTWFLPFLTPGAHAAWGLPDALYDPVAVFRHVLSTLAPGGVLLVLTQGKADAEVQEDLFIREDLVVDVIGRIDSPLSPFQKPRYAFLYRAPRPALRLV